MKLSDAERGLLLSKMGDDTIASILERRESWVRKARAWLAANPAEKINTPVSEKPRAVRNSSHGDPTLPRLRRPARDLREGDVLALRPAPAGGAPPGPEDQEPEAVGDRDQVAPVQVIITKPPSASMSAASRYGWPPFAPPRLQPAAVAAKPATRPPVAPPAPDPGITPAVLRYAKWFHDAKWTWREISELFEVEAIALRYALTGELPQA